MSSEQDGAEHVWTVLSLKIEILGTQEFGIYKRLEVEVETYIRQSWTLWCSYGNSGLSCERVARYSSILLPEHDSTVRSWLPKDLYIATWEQELR